MVMSLTGIMDKITKENQHLRAREAELQVNAGRFTGPDYTPNAGISSD